MPILIARIFIIGYSCGSRANGIPVWQLYISRIVDVDVDVNVNDGDNGDIDGEIDGEIDGMFSFYYVYLYVYADADCGMIDLNVGDAIVDDWVVGVVIEIARYSPSWSSLIRGID